MHGGFWKEKYSIDNACVDSLIPHIISNGKFAVYMIEYRRIPDVEAVNYEQLSVGCYPRSNNDIVNSLHALHNRKESATSSTKEDHVLVLIF